jgi:hypothetical protein
MGHHGFPELLVQILVHVQVALRDEIRLPRHEHDVVLPG